ncbi:AhpC/TSA family protein [Frankia sp. AgPm24]|uniref:peroxiredoxin-like family protein n=1 Tax=Frankia sp. AgPm24 TaxID=631128 RepID=UPI00200CFAAD|nr:peroxiredoxin-like family protein [Frankia sp. AgPm24]MCK9923369.1 AhpC/TSA family protein [Frankia sp. AgPm24]
MSTSEAASTSLTAATLALRSQLHEAYGADALAPFDSNAEAMAADGVGSTAPSVGTPAPRFVLPDVHGTSRALDDLLASGPVVLVFYRGAWCPYCNLQLHAFQGSLGEIEATGATLVAVSPQTPDNSLSFAEKEGLGFTVLSDLHNRVARDYGLVFRQDDVPTAVQKGIGTDLADFNGDDSYELPVATTFVIDTDGTIRFRSVSADYRWRVGPEEVLAALHGLR